MQIIWLYIICNNHLFLKQDSWNKYLNFLSVLLQTPPNPIVFVNIHSGPNQFFYYYCYSLFLLDFGTLNIFLIVLLLVVNRIDNHFREWYFFTFELYTPSFTNLIKTLFYFNEVQNTYRSLVFMRKMSSNVQENRLITICRHLINIIS